MGCGYNYACRTCRVTANMGYGSYTTWVTERTLEAFQAVIARAPDLLDRAKNQHISDFLTKHQGHDVYPINWDYHRARGGALVSETGFYGADEMVIPDYGTYREEEA